MVIKMPQLGLQETFIPIKKKRAPCTKRRGSRHLAVRVRVRLVRLVERLAMMIVVGILGNQKLG
jgi:hypothetical protein